MFVIVSIKNPYMFSFLNIRPTKCWPIITLLVIDTCESYNCSVRSDMFTSDDKTNFLNCVPVCHWCDIVVFNGLKMCIADTAGIKTVNMLLSIMCDLPLRHLFFGWVYLRTCRQPGERLLCREYTETPHLQMNGNLWLVGSRVQCL